MNQKDIASLLQQLRDSARRLSSDPPAQEAYLREIKTWPLLDELALDFDDSYLPLADNGLLNPAQLQALQRLQQALEMIGGSANAQLWDGESGALRSLEWQRIRALASAASATLESPATQESR